MFPEELLYTDEHEWVRRSTTAVVRVGITSFATSELGDVVFVSLPEVGQAVTAGDSCAEVESTKSVSEVYSPLTGVITATNAVLADAPETVNSDPYGTGWLFELEVSDFAPLEKLLSAAAYSELVSG